MTSEWFVLCLFKIELFVFSFFVSANKNNTVKFRYFFATNTKLLLHFDF